MKAFYKGQLIVKPTRAQLKRDTDTLGKMDPYVLIFVGDKKERTKTHKNAGKNPAWFDEFEFYKKNEETLFFEVHDDDTGKDDLIGSGSISLDPICVEKPVKFSNSAKIFYKGKYAGDVYFELDFKPKSKHGKPITPKMSDPYKIDRQ